MGKVVQVAPREALLGVDAVHGLAIFLNTLPESRRRVLDWLADTLFGWIEDGGIVLDDDGHEIEITDTIIDDAHGRDASVKTVSDMRRYATNPPQRRRRQSMLLRLQLYDAAARMTTGRSIVDFGRDEGEDE